MNRWLAAATIAATLLAPAVGYAATIQTRASDPTAIRLNGEIVKGDLDRIKSALYENDKIKFLFLNSEGGNVLAAAEIAEFLYTHPKLATVVDENNVCLSACTLIMAGSRTRWASQSSDRLSFHCYV